MDNIHPCVSVVVPLYRAERYFPVLLESLQNQTLQNIELIFVDDRGGDRSYEMAKKAAETDKRIKCLQNEKNSGAGYSRNRGIEVATGEFIAFADADDWVEPDYYERLFTKAKKQGALVAKGQLRRFQPDGIFAYSRMHEWQRLHYINPEDSMLNRFVYEHTCGLYSRHLVMSTGARYAENTQFGEDTFFLLRLMLHVKGSQFVLDEKAIYTYRVNQSSIIQQKKDASFLIEVQTGALAKIDLLLQQKSSEAVVWYVNYMFNQNLGDIINDAIKSDIPDSDIIQYLQLFAPRLQKWKESDIKYSPGIQASALQNCGYDAALFLKKRKEQLQTPQTKSAPPPEKSPEDHKQMKIDERYHEELISLRRFTILHACLPKLKQRYIILSLRSMISFGGSREKCKMKRKRIKSLLAEYRQIQKSIYFQNLVE